MTEQKLQEYLRLLFPIENERCEWKEFSVLKQCVRGSEGNDIISYVSALANMDGGALVIGVEDRTLNIVGIRDFVNYTAENLPKTLLDTCTNLSSEGLSVDQYITDDTQKIVWVVNIPRHKPRQPVLAHKKAWQRVGDSLVEMRKERHESILNEVMLVDDWSAKIVPDATINDLSSEAIAKARTEYKKRNPKYADQADQWSDEVFLNKANLTRNGRITHTTLILLGKSESEYLLNPSVVKIRWNLKALDNTDKDFDVFSMPLILSVEDVLAKIRNLKYRYLKDNTLFPDELLRYEPFNIRELLHNCIAHQDYTKGARINVVEFEDDHLVFTNYGTFIPKSIEAVVNQDAPEEYYRNPYLVEAMRNLNMIDTQGGGIKKIFNYQRRRSFPMPDYEFADTKVKVVLTGRIIDENFARILTNNPSLSLADIMVLDRVQKRCEINQDELKYLRRLGLIEGRKNSVYLSFRVITPTNDDGLKAQYVRNKSFDDRYFKRMIVEYVKKYGSARRKAIDGLLMEKLSEALSDEQKKNKIGNLLTGLRKEGVIKNDGFSNWKFNK